MVGQIIAGGVALFLTLIAFAALGASVASAFRRDWRFAGGALVFVVIFGLHALMFWDSAVTGKRMTPDYDAPRLR